MKKVVISLLLIQFAVLNSVAQYSQNYDFSVSGEKMQVNVQNKGIVKFQKAESKGKLATTFMKKWCPPNPEKENIYLGPFNQNLISGKQDIFNCYHYDGYKHKIMANPRGFYFKYIQDYFSKGDHDIKILAYSKPELGTAVYPEYLMKDMTEAEKANLKRKLKKTVVDRLSQGKDGKRLIPDIYYMVYNVYYLPKDELKKELSRLHTLGLEEAKSLVIKNFEDAKYYNYYYGKGNPDNYEYSEAVISKGYEAMKNIEEKVAYFNLFYYSSNAKSWQESLLKSATDFYLN